MAVSEYSKLMVLNSDFDVESTNVSVFVRSSDTVALRDCDGERVRDQVMSIEIVDDNDGDADRSRDSDEESVGSLETVALYSWESDELSSSERLEVTFVTVSSNVTV